MEKKKRVSFPKKFEVENVIVFIVFEFLTISNSNKLRKKYEVRKCFCVQIIVVQLIGAWMG